MILLTDKAVNTFKQDNNFSVSAEAGLSIIKWSKAGEASYGKGDVVMWADTEGLFAGVELAVGDISSDEDARPADHLWAAGDSRRHFAGQGQKPS